MDFSYVGQKERAVRDAQTKSFLLWNGLGGYCSMCGDFSVNRADNGILVAAVKAPNERITLVHRLAERLQAGGQEILLSTQDFADAAPAEAGEFWLERHSNCGIPVWQYRVGAISVERTCAMAYGENTTALLYSLHNGLDTPCTFTVTPYLKFAPKEAALTDRKDFKRNNGQITADGYTLYVHTQGTILPFTDWQDLCYPADEADGRPGHGLAGSCCKICNYDQSGLIVLFGRSQAIEAQQLFAVFGGPVSVFEKTMMHTVCQCRNLMHQCDNVGQVSFRHSGSFLVTAEPQKL